MPPPAAPTDSKLTAGLLYNINTHYPNRDWFGLKDCAARVLTSVGLYYYCLATRPLSTTRYVYAWNKAWFGTKYGLLSAAMAVWYPGLVGFWALWKRLKPYLV